MDRKAMVGGVGVVALAALVIGVPSRPDAGPDAGGWPGPYWAAMETLTNQQILDAGLTDWRKLAQALFARFRTGDFVTGLAFVTAVAEAAERRATIRRDPDLPVGRPAAGQPRRRRAHPARPRPRPPDQRDRPRRGASPRSRRAARGRARARHRRRRRRPDRSGPRCSPGAPTRTTATTSSTRAARAAAVVPGHRRPRRRASASTSTCGCRTTSRRSGSPPRSRRAVASSTTTPRPSFVVLADPEGNRACVCTSLER